MRAPAEAPPGCIGRDVVVEVRGGRVGSRGIGTGVVWLGVKGVEAQAVERELSC
jgi:hypothetical protein